MKEHLCARGRQTGDYLELFPGWFTRRGFVFVNLQSCAIHALLEMRVNIWHPGCFPSRGTICIVDCNIAQG